MLVQKKYKNTNNDGTMYLHTKVNVVVGGGGGGGGIWY